MRLMLLCNSFFLEISIRRENNLSSLGILEPAMLKIILLFCRTKSGITSINSLMPFNLENRPKNKIFISLLLFFFIELCFRNLTELGKTSILEFGTISWNTSLSLTCLFDKVVNLERIKFCIQKRKVLSKVFKKEPFLGPSKKFPTSWFRESLGFYQNHQKFPDASFTSETENITRDKAPRQNSPFLCTDAHDFLAPPRKIS